MAFDFFILLSDNRLEVAPRFRGSHHHHHSGGGGKQFIFFFHFHCSHHHPIFVGYLYPNEDMIQYVCINRYCDIF
ncbi:hypothetical protein DERF_013953 [Dermatophagoides farinae]|uniref:Uncharacterized protein n=1 Tax=Dermatophagoides farinae TaxID=6954 RepID=A0A922HRA5_DERFA|nr:hypothetical protein DERF_013953 [Dermatophagoides farinae]